MGFVQVENYSPSPYCFWEYTGRFARAARFLLQLPEILARVTS